MGSPLLNVSWDQCLLKPAPDRQAEAACTAVAHAIARGDERRVQDFSRVDISGLVAP